MGLDWQSPVHERTAEGATRLPVLALTMALVLAGCSPSEKRAAPEIVAAKEAVQALLLDPDSAQFRKLMVRPANGSLVSVCGEVNAKNRMGGYNGFQRFYYIVAAKEAGIDPLEEGRHVDALTSADEINAWNKFERGWMDNCILNTTSAPEES